jgi:hypothetical protein
MRIHSNIYGLIHICGTRTFTARVVMEARASRPRASIPSIFRRQNQSTKIHLASRRRETRIPSAVWPTDLILKKPTGCSAPDGMVRTASADIRLGSYACMSHPCTCFHVILPLELRTCEGLYRLSVLGTCYACAMHVPCMRDALAMHARCTCHACAMHVPCMRDARAMHARCTCHACAMHLPCMRDALAMHAREQNHEARPDKEK